MTLSEVSAQTPYLSFWQVLGDDSEIAACAERMEAAMADDPDSIAPTRWLVVRKHSDVMDYLRLSKYPSSKQCKAHILEHPQTIVLLSRRECRMPQRPHPDQEHADA